MKAKNSLCTLACGDAYGNAFEMDGLIGVRFDKDLLPDQALIKNYTDDTKMPMMLWVHYGNYGTIVEDKLFEAYANWAEKDGASDGIGIHTAGVLLRGKENKDSQCNGALMRVLPFGLRLIDAKNAPNWPPIAFASSHFCLGSEILYSLKIPYLFGGYFLNLTTLFVFKYACSKTIFF
jgi:ADP-ribosylglycohydrolase